MYVLASGRKCTVNFGLLFMIYINIIFTTANNPLQEVDEIFDEIEKDHSRLKTLFESIVEKPPPSVITLQGKQPNMTMSCVCVPVYLCNDDGIVNTDGGSFLIPRVSDEEGIPTCPNLIDICCQHPVEKPLQESTCGFGGNILNNEMRIDPVTSLFGEFPWTVMVLENSVNYVCAGTLIHPQVVLTAAHCVNTTGNYTVRVGEWDVTSRSEPIPHQFQYVQTVIVHPHFNPSNMHYDAALLVVPNPFKLKDNVNIACITEFAPYNLKPTYDKCVATGWGYDKLAEMYKRVMKRIEFSLVNHKQCEDRFRTTTHLGKWFELHKSFICAAGANGFDVCTGDGGGPLVCPISGTSTRYQLVGITAWGIGCAEKTPSVFVRVSELKHWIDGWFEVLQFTKDYEYESLRFLF